MKTKDVIRYFTTQVATAEALGMSQSSIAGWGDTPPDNRQLLIEKITNGALKADDGCYDRVIGYKAKQPHPSAARSLSAIETESTGSAHA